MVDQWWIVNGFSVVDEWWNVNGMSMVDQWWIVNGIPMVAQFDTIRVPFIYHWYANESEKC